MHSAGEQFIPCTGSEKVDLFCTAGTPNFTRSQKSNGQSAVGAGVVYTGLGVVVNGAGVLLIFMQPLFIAVSCAADGGDVNKWMSL
jgi:hypothetical protein